MLTLRPYQTKVIADIRAQYAAGARRILCQGPTGSGKTVQFGFVVSNAIARGNRVVVLGHRDEILCQISDAFDQFGIAHALVTAGYNGAAAPVIVASVATLTQRLHLLDGVALIVVDEAHHSPAASWRRILEAAPSARILGTTATPERLDGAGLSGLFDVLVIGPTVAELIAGGWLSSFAVFAPERLSI